MSDKLSDNEIIKAMECCKNRQCCVCPRLKTVTLPESACRHELLEIAVELINRQNAEKEALIAGQETLQKYIAEQKAEIDYWKRNAFDGCMERSRIEKTAKAEAIKEFAERLKEKTEYLFSAVSIRNEVDNLVQEMVGDDK